MLTMHSLSNGGGHTESNNSASAASAGPAVHKTRAESRRAAKMASGPTNPDPLTQRAVLEQLFERRLVEGEFWYVVVAEWFEQLKKYLGIPSSRKSYHQRVHPGPVITRRDYAHTVEVIHEDAWKMLVQWYGLAEGHKAMKLVVYNYKRAPEIEHHLNPYKLMLTTSPIEDFHNVKFSKMEKVGHVEWKARQLYNIPMAYKTRLWAKADTDSDWKPLLVRDKPIGKALEIDSDFTRPFVALEVRDDEAGTWCRNPEGTQPTQDCPIGILYDHDIFEDVTSTWELDIHEQIDHIGRDFIDRLHINFSSFVLRAKEFVEDRDSVLRERERKLSSKEAHFDNLDYTLRDKEQRLDAELEACGNRIRLYDRKEDELEDVYEKKFKDLETMVKQRKGELDKSITALENEKRNFDNEMKRMSEMYKIQENKIKLDIGGQQFTTSLLTLTKDPNSMFAVMFSGRHELKKETDGSYFIDRDGSHFRYILNYLRDGCIKEGTMPANEALWSELLCEAEYYQLDGLVEYLRTLLHRSSRSNSSDG